MEWKALPMINGWINQNSDSAAALKYRKGADGKVVYVTGRIKQPNAITNDNRVIAYLPAGYRPKNYYWRTLSSETKDSIVTLRINLDGKMYILTQHSNVQTMLNSDLPICLTIPI